MMYATPGIALEPPVELRNPPVLNVKTEQVGVFWASWTNTGNALLSTSSAVSSVNGEVNTFRVALWKGRNTSLMQ